MSVDDTFERRMRIMFEVAKSQGCAVTFEEFTKTYSEEEKQRASKDAMEKARQSGKKVLSPELAANAQAMVLEFLEIELDK